MRPLLASTCLAAASLLLAAAAPAEPGVVATQNGRVRGAVADGVLSFKGIPFAAPPLGALRWRAPQPPASWSGVRDATGYAHDCAQKPFPSDAAPLGTTPAEDCLYLNVWRPAAPGRKLPVLVWIYGGGFVNGGSSPPTYAGAAIAKQGVVFVSFNYRLGRFGFFANKGLPPGTVDDGILDQIAALRWVRQNVAAFGGDPDEVTVDGESAGGMSVNMLLASPMARGLFERAVIQSGGNGDLMLGTPASAEAAGEAFDRKEGIDPDSPKAVAALRALPTAAVVDGLNMGALFHPASGPRTYTLPVVDGTVVVDPPAAYRAGQFAHVPVMVGATGEDLGGPNGPMMTGAPEVAGLLSAQGVPVFLYRFSYVADSLEAAGVTGAKHATDIPFFFDTARIKYGAAATVRDRKAARLANAYLVNFVKTGNPNGPGLVTWPAYTTQTGAMLELDRTGGATLAHD